MCLGVCVFASAYKKKSQKRRIKGDREEGGGGVSQSGCLVSLYDLAPGRKGRKKRLKNVCVCVCVPLCEDKAVVHHDRNLLHGVQLGEGRSPMFSCTHKRS